MSLRMFTFGATILAASTVAMAQTSSSTPAASTTKAPAATAAEANAKAAAKTDNKADTKVDAKRKPAADPAYATRDWAAIDTNKDNLISPEEMEAYLKANPGPLAKPR